MTLLASINGPETIWFLADRRISWSARPPKDDAQKIVLLRAVDGLAILGYAGLGITALGTEPSEWMRSVLDKRGYPLEESLAVLASAMERELPPHLMQLPMSGRTHGVLAPAFYGDWNSSSARLYSIDPISCPKHGAHFRVVRHDMANTGIPIPVMVAGSGGTALMKLMEDRSRRSTLRLMVRACAKGRILASAVADYLALLNHEVHKINLGVGPRCIVVWRHRLGGNRFGGGYLYYTAGRRERQTPDPSLMPPLINVESSGLVRVLNRMAARESGEPVDEALEKKTNKWLLLSTDFPDNKLE
jgi:hypothetical protein